MMAKLILKRQIFKEKLFQTNLNFPQSESAIIAPKTGVK